MFYLAMMLGNRIRDLREEKGLSLKELALGASLDPSLLSRIEKGKRVATIEQVKKISQYMNIEYSLFLKIWMEDKVIHVIKEYPQFAHEVLQAAESRIEYMQSDSVLQEVKINSVVINKLEEIDELKNSWSKEKPLNGIQLEKLKEYFVNHYTYESNKIEGNTLTMKETFLVVNQGLTIGGKSMVEHLEAINHNEAVELMYDIIDRKVHFNRSVLLQLHGLILRGIDSKNAGIFRKIPVRIGGSKHIPPEPFLIDKLMEDFFLYYSLNKKKVHPVILAAEMHERLVSIHPFVDGNGRTARLVMNLILLQNGFPIAILKGNNKSRMEYYDSLEKVQLDNNYLPFYKLVMRCCKESLQEHLNLC